MIGVGYWRPASDLVTTIPPNGVVASNVAVPNERQIMSETAMLADHIDQQVEEILAVWKSTVERLGNVPDSDRLSYREFVDHIPELLDRLADRLRGRQADAGETGQKHGQHRWSQGYDIAEVVTELGHLRSTLLRDTFAFAREQKFALGRIESMITAIDDVLDEATAESVGQFQSDSQALNRAMLDTFEERRLVAESERIKLQTVLDNLPVGVWVCDGFGNIIVANREAERLQGFPEKEIVGRLNVADAAAVYRLFRPDGATYGPDDFPMVRALRGDTIIQEELIWPVGGRRQHVTANAAPLTSGDGSITGAVVVIQDVSERNRLEGELAFSEAQFRGIVAKSPVMIWRSNTSGSCDFFNETWLEFRGRTLDQEAGSGWTEGIHPEDLDRYQLMYRQAFDRREPFEIVYRLRHADGDYRHVTDRGAPYCDARGAFLGYLGSCLDITSRVALEGELKQQSQHKSRLMAALSHDARTPLNAVVLSAKLLESQVKGDDDPEIKDSLRTIHNAVGNVLDLLSDLLDLSRIDAGATLAENSKFSLGATLSECLSSIEPQARAKGLDIRFEPDALADARLETDRAKLKQILSNLLSNALRYTERGHVRLFARRVDSHVQIGVEDTGVGIAEQDQARIFDEFAVLEHPNRARGEGTGLGLAICRRLANLLHGEILLDSKVGRGSTFILALPDTVITEGSAAAVAAAKPSASNPSRDFTGPILIAEDHADSRRTLGKVLRRMGYRVLEAGDGREVLELVRHERPMLVLMDVNMPDLDGVETTLALRNDPEFQDLPIFALTGDVSILNQQRIGDAGVNGYLEKPVTWEKLEAALANLRDGR